MTVQIYTLDLLLSLSCCKMCLIESSVDDALVFSVFRSEDSLEDRFAIKSKAVIGGGHLTANVARTPLKKWELNSNWLTAGKVFGSILSSRFWGGALRDDAKNGCVED